MAKEQEHEEVAVAILTTNGHPPTKKFTNKLIEESMGYCEDGVYVTTIAGSLVYKPHQLLYQMALYNVSEIWAVAFGPFTTYTLYVFRGAEFETLKRRLVEAVANNSEKTSFEIAMNR